MLIGFLCPRDGKNRPFDYCWSKCLDLCAPITVLLALAKQVRATEENVYHVTEILNPPQVTWLMRNKDYYVPPDSLIDMNIGTSWHEKIDSTKKYVKELGLKDEYIMEKKFKRVYLFDVERREIVEGDEIAEEDRIESVYLTGTPDLYVTSTDTIWDYKVVKYYHTLKYMKEEKWEDNSYVWQLNIYRRFTHPKAKMKLYCYVKDWKRGWDEKHGVTRLEVVELPHIADRVIDEKVKSLLAEHVKNQKHPSNIRQCAERERWVNSWGVPIRCEDYCSVSRICPQYRRS